MLFNVLPYPSFLNIVKTNIIQVNGQVKQTAMKMFKKKMLPFPEPIRKFLWLDIIKNSARKSESKGSKKTKVISNLIESRLI
jgi:hypothetical protein